MLEIIPTNEEMISLLGQPLFDVWLKLTHLIESRYDMELLWNNDGKKWIYEYKYRRN